jgi:hypothetical protein
VQTAHLRYIIFDSTPSERYELRDIIFALHAEMREHHLNYESELIAEQQAMVTEVISRANSLSSSPDFSDDHLADDY